MARGESLYRLDVEALKGIQPDLIITQDLCRVCAASPGDLNQALAVLPRVPRVLSLNPTGLADVWNDIRKVGEVTGRAREAEEVVSELERRVAAVENAVSAVSLRPRVLCLEWLDPPFVAGHWVPEMVARAGGTDVMGRKGEPGFRTSWGKVFAARPQVIVLMPCGYDLKKTVEESKQTQFPAGWKELPAVKEGRVYAVDPSSYFSRPGPRLATGVEILAHLLHPGHVVAVLPRAAVERLG
jgi:iron complex transport system substrate-binding protein